jgi:hypothetical protein
MKERNDTKNVFQNDEDFLTLVAQEARSDNYQKALRNVEQGPHPTDEMLYDYVWGELDKQEARIIRIHIAFCGICAEEVLRLRLVEEELEEKVLDWMNGEGAVIMPQIHPPVPPLRGDYPPVSPSRELHPPVPPSRGDYPPLPLPGGELFEGIATEYWEPQWTEQQATAADIPEQAHVFRREDGDIEISCFWRSQYRKKPAYISISWRANVTTRNEIRARFINSETREHLAEVDLGTHLMGEEIFTSDDLGFDPSSERWAMALVLKEVGAT